MQDPGEDGVAGDGVYAGGGFPSTGSRKDLLCLDNLFHFLAFGGFFFGLKIGLGGASSSSS